MKQNKSANIYIGSYFDDEKNNIGIGWVTTNHKDKKPSIHSKRLHKREANELLADIAAVTNALEISKKDRNITIHTTSPDIAEVFTISNFGEKIGRARHNEPLRKAWEKLARVVQQHNEITVIQHSDCDKQTHLKQAFNAAKTGSAKSFSKDGAQENMERKHGKNLIQEDILDMQDTDPHDYKGCDVA